MYYYMLFSPMPTSQYTFSDIEKYRLDVFSVTVLRTESYVIVLVLTQGVGTAIGELPPYFMARAARLSGAEPDDEEYQEFEEMLEHAEAAQVRAVSRGKGR